MVLSRWCIFAFITFIHEYFVRYLFQGHIISHFGDTHVVWPARFIVVLKNRMRNEVAVIPKSLIHRVMANVVKKLDSVETGGGNFWVMFYKLKWHNFAYDLVLVKFTKHVISNTVILVRKLSVTWRPSVIYTTTIS